MRGKANCSYRHLSVKREVSLEARSAIEVAERRNRAPSRVESGCKSGKERVESEVDVSQAVVLASASRSTYRLTGMHV